MSMRFVAGFWLSCLSVCLSETSVQPVDAGAPAVAAVVAKPRVLTYAGVGTEPGQVSPADFEREMLYLKESGATVLNPAEYLNPAGGEVKELPLHALLLTFTDVQQEGFRLHALPILKRCGFPYMVVTEEATMADGEGARVTDDASFARAVNFGSPSQAAAILADVKACTPAVNSLPQNVVLPEFTDDDVADDTGEVVEVEERVEPSPAASGVSASAAPIVAEGAASAWEPAEPDFLDPTPIEVVSIKSPTPLVVPPSETEAVVSATPEPETPVVSPGAEVAGSVPVVEPACGVLGKRTPEGDWVTTQFKQPLVPREQTRVSVLGYHNFSKTKACTDMRMSTADFCRQMQFLKDSDICVISMQDFLEWRFGTRCLPARCVLITIDDGWKSVYTDAYPVLKAYGYPFTLYLYTRYIDVQGDSMTTAQIKEMLAHGATVGSHSSNHLYPSKWKRFKQDSPEYAAQLEKELLASREKLVEKFGNCSTYCYPGGYNTPAMHATLAASEYQAAFTVLESKVTCEESAYQVHRYMVFGTQHEIFRRAVTFGGTAAVAATRAAIAAAEQPARQFFPAAFEGCTNRAPAAPAKKKTSRKTTAKPAADTASPQIVKDPSLTAPQPSESSNVL